jgi:hypothetical protein
MSHHASVYGVSLSDIKQMYGASDFVEALARFVVHIQHPEYARAGVELTVSNLPLPLHKEAANFLLNQVSYTGSFQFVLNS